MSPNVFVLVLGIGAAFLAAWAEVRFPKLAPSDLSRIMLHLLVVTVGVTVLVPKLLDAAIGLGLVLEAVFVIALPALVYCMLVGFWILRFLSDKLDRLTHH